MRPALLAWLAAAAFLWCGATAAPAAPLRIVAAENFYGDIAQQIGGEQVIVTSILSDPSQDPHLFEASPSVARALADADLVVQSGADYDPWVGKLLSGQRSGGRGLIVVAALVGHKAGDNPHIWYDPRTLHALAAALADELSRRDPAHAPDYAARLRRFRADMQPLEARMAEMKRRFAGAAVTASEPVFGPMAAALGLVMRNESFQLAKMNDTEPSASAVIAMETDLRQGRVRALLYNSQVVDSTTQRLQELARGAGVPVVGVTETMPAGVTYPQWMLGQLNALAQALESSAR
jgi:zinc/manganese transport system substrate-binding protein